MESSMWQGELDRRARAVAHKAIMEADAQDGGVFGAQFRGRGRVPYLAHLGYADRSFRVEITVSDCDGRMPLSSGKRVIRKLIDAGANVTGDPVLHRLATILADDREVPDVEQALVLTITALAKQRADLLEHVERMTRERPPVAFVVDTPARKGDA